MLYTVSRMLIIFYKEQKKGDRTVKKDDTMKTFGYKRPQE